jgi:LysM repeat protein
VSVRVSRQRVSRYVAPAAFLLGVTVAVLLVRAGLGGPAAATGTFGAVTQAGATLSPKPATTATIRRATTATIITFTESVAGATYYIVKRGDTFYSIATKEGTSVSELESLNPGVSSNALSVGQKIRVK